MCGLTWRTMLALLQGVLLLAWMTPGMAAWSWTSLAKPAEESFLPAEQAFRLESEQRHDRVILRWQIAQGYYLYRDRLSFALSPEAAQASGAPYVLGTPQIPPGQPKDDPFLGLTAVFHNQLTVTIPIHKTTSSQKPPPQGISLVVRYQGCAAKGLCYPPQEVPITLQGQHGPVAPAPPTAQQAGLIRDQQPQTDDNQALRLLERGSWWLLLAFVGFGVLLSLTPCVWPMIPLLLRITATEHGRRRRSIAGAGAYVLGMACAYGLLGVVAGFTGSNLQFAWQHPLVLLGSALLLVLLACSSFGLFDLQLPPAWQTRLQHLAGMPAAGRLGATWLVGLISAWIAGPCVTPALAGAMLYITRSGDVLLGAAALFALGLGMGLPLLTMALLGERWLPRSGPWMRGVNHVIGLLLLGGAVLLVQRILPSWGVSLAALLWLVALGALVLRHLPARMAVGSLCVAILGIALWHWPQAFSPTPAGPPAQHQASPRFVAIDNLEQLQRALQQAKQERRAVMLDIYADWCTACQAMERRIFADATVHEALDDVVWLRSDITANTKAHRKMLQRLGVIGPPTVLFFPPGQQVAPQRLVGELDKETFLRRAQDLIHG